MKKEGAMFKNRVAIIIVLACTIPIGHAQEQSETNQLLIPEGLTIERSDNTQLQRGNLQIEEVRIGGRLERLTVRRQFGVTEIYQNQRDDEIWFSEEKELGAVQNVRQWKLGSW